MLNGALGTITTCEIAVGIALAIGTAIAQQNLRSVLGFCNSPQMNAPEAYIQFKPGLIDDADAVTVPETEAFLRSFMNAYAVFVARVLTVLPRGGS